MSKRALKKYVSGLDREALAEHLIDLYDRFPEVKAYYDFVFNPKEEELLREAKVRISREYTARGRRRPKARRSVAQKFIRHYRTLGMDPHLLADLMGFNLETAFRYEQGRKCPDAFYRSMLNSCREWAAFLVHQGLWGDFEPRFRAYVASVEAADWPNRSAFEALDDQLTHTP